MKTQIAVTTTPRFSPATVKWLRFHAAFPISMVDLIELTKTPAQRTTKKIQLIRKELESVYKDALACHFLYGPDSKPVMIHAEDRSEPQPLKLSDIKVGQEYELKPGVLYIVTAIASDHVAVDVYIHGEFMDKGAFKIKTFLEKFSPREKSNDCE